MLTLLDRVPERVAARIQLLLASVPDREAATRCLERLRQASPSAFDRITSSPAALRAAANVFSYSAFLSDAVLKNPEQILQVANSGSFYRVLSVEEFEERLYDLLGAGHGGVPSGVELARFRRRQLLRIVLRDVLGVAGLADVTEELSSLADAILSVAYRHLRDDFVARYGEPRLADGSPCAFSVIALGKLGGQELNYSSDIDLMFVYGGNGQTAGPEVITNKEFYKKVANQYTQLLSTYTAEGQCYRVDLRLRPDGTLGEVAISGDGARDYYGGRARDWEKQMLIKARVAAGEPEPGAALLEFVEPLIYQTSLDFRAVEAVSETRQRISEKMAGRRNAPRRHRHQAHARRHSRHRVSGAVPAAAARRPRDMWVRHGGTMFALFRLRDKGLLSGGEYARLASAYQFLRYLEHRLQMEDDRQTHTLPTTRRR
jgi:[glutamine synthetase] adenylyltransferase / [glutamine synthetase]-adenylyl-L-tyrosine phosphorylase